jgi:hypothetical protein
LDQNLEEQEIRIFQKDVGGWEFISGDGNSMGMHANVPGMFRRITLGQK